MYEDQTDLREMDEDPSGDPPSEPNMESTLPVTDSADEVTRRRLNQRLRKQRLRNRIKKLKNRRRNKNKPSGENLFIPENQTLLGLNIDGPTSESNDESNSQDTGSAENVTGKRRKRRLAARKRRKRL
jgi:hypothetical protein